MEATKKRSIVKVVNEREGQKVIAYVYTKTPSEPNLNNDFFMERVGDVPKGAKKDKLPWTLVDPNEEWEQELNVDRVVSMRALRSYANMVDSRSELREIIGDTQIPC